VKPLHVVWFKRDLRVHDHAPLTRAVQAANAAGGAVLCLYVFEPSVMQAGDYAAQHFAFAKECLAELSAELAQRGATLHIVTSEVIDTLAAIHATHPITQLWSHEETGNAITYARDLAVSAWTKSQAITWNEIAQFGVVRKLASRNGWATRWERHMRAPQIKAPTVIPAAQFSLQFPQITTQFSENNFPEPDKPHRQRGGRTLALRALESFLTTRGLTYQRGMSSPNTAPQVCSRLSPYLALGVLSMREVAQRLHLEQARNDKASGFSASMRSFEGRLHWHCHFIQKLESEPAIEFRAMMRALDAVRPETLDEEATKRLRAWENGHTGYPLIDACMRSLNATGWLTFRMRAMVVSFASYNLWLDWRHFSHYLARGFLDYEPGIHYSQLQMQSGVTGINALRIYNPIKQAQEHDTEGTFVKRWCPELAQLPAAQISAPWELTQMEQEQFGVRIGIDYPAPIVDWVTSYRFAREQFGALRRSLEVKTEAGAVMEKHGSRKSGMRITGTRSKAKKSPQVENGQQTLF
jgi:deoxyribodipyrimidine photo-lyase